MPSKSSKAFNRWKKRMGYSTKEVAMSLDITNSAVGYYCAGQRREKVEHDFKDVDVPIIVLLACAAVEAGLGPIC